MLLICSHQQDCVMAEPESTPAEVEGRPRATKRKAVVATRDRRIVNYLVIGLNPTEIARRERLSLRRTQQLIKSILARRRDSMPDYFVDLQITRLHEAFLFSYSAMADGNLKAVDRVVQIVRELDRYYGFVGPKRPDKNGNAK